MDTPNDFKDIESFDVCHLPIIKAFCDKIGLSYLIDNALKAKCKVSCGKIVTGLVVDTLTGRNPLYRVDDFFSHQDIELVVGKGVASSDFNDDKIARVLDRIFEYGTSKLFCEISLEAVRQFNIDTTQVHHDTTSVSVWGQYEGYEKSPFEINNGYSKDKRPDLKQFIFSLLCVEKDIPIEAKIYSGNDDDKTISKNVLGRISKYMSAYKPGSDGFIFVADSALVDKKNLKDMGPIDSPCIKFVSRMPATFGAAYMLIAEAVSKNCWADIGRLSKAKTREAGAYYKSYETQVKIDNKTYRTIVIHSDFYDRRKQKKIDKETQKDLEKAKKIKKKLTSIEYFCKKDAQVAADKQKPPKYHKLKISIEEKKIYKKGRPKNGKKEVAKIRYVLDIDVLPDDKLIENLKEEAGCFVLISNVGPGEHSAAGILKIYKEQYGIEKNFGFLKDPLIVNDLFLKKPERIEALGFILVISLLLWRLAERSMRRYIGQKKTTITGWNKRQTESPTAVMMSTKFCSTHVLKKGKTRWLSRPINTVQRQYLEALGLSEEIFYTVRE